MRKVLSLLVFILIFISCSSVRVITDYDTQTDFEEYKTFAFYKKGIDKAPISDLDKKRIMRAIEAEMLAKGFRKSNNPDLLVSIFTKSREKINVTDNRFGTYWYPWYYGVNQVRVTQRTEGTLFIDFIDKKKKELIWQGIGTGALRMQNVKKKEERVKEFVKEVLEKYPPKVESK
ncbi:MAG: DUF4136 domain-containing protein [Flavobacteriaceae bacterium]